MSQSQPSRRNNQATLTAGSLILLILIYLAFQWLSGRSPQQEPGAAEAPAATATQAVATEPPATVADVAATEPAAAPEPEEESVAVQPTEPPDSKPTATPTELAQPPPTPTPALTPTPVATATPTYEPRSRLPLILYAELPPEAYDTIDLIDRGGPFPYRKDGSTFQNREGFLPDEPRGYYREYTVETPGSPDRGARRIVAGEDGEMYYTDDHYASFSEIVR